MNPNPNKETPEQELTYGFDPASPDGDMSALTIQDGDRVFTFIGDEAEVIQRLIATHYKAREAEQRPIGDAIEVKVSAQTMRFVLNACKQSDRTIAKRILENESDVTEWRDVSNDESIELKIWQLKVLASLTGKYNWAVFLLKPDNLPGSKDSNL